jgi:uncharacterized protein YjbJ (UPF0337 family)
MKLKRPAYAGRFLYELWVLSVSTDTSSPLSFMVNAPSSHDDAVENQSEGRWQQFVGRAQEAYGDLTGDWSDQFHGNRRQAMGWLQEKYGDAEEKLAEFMDDDDEA